MNSCEEFFELTPYARAQWDNFFNRKFPLGPQLFVSSPSGEFWHCPAVSADILFRREYLLEVKTENFEVVDFL